MATMPSVIKVNPFKDITVTLKVSKVRFFRARVAILVMRLANLIGGFNRLDIEFDKDSPCST